MLPASKINKYDSKNVAFWWEHENRYVCYFRTFRKFDKRFVRWVSGTTSSDFVHWSEPVEMNFGEAPPEDLYTNQTSPYFRTPHAHRSRRSLLPQAAGADGRRPKKSAWTSFITKTFRTGYCSQRAAATVMTAPSSRAFSVPGSGPGNWVSRTNYPALNVGQTGPAEMSVYVARDYAQPTAHLVRFSMRLDGFASVHAGYQGAR